MTSTPAGDRGRRSLPPPPFPAVAIQLIQQMQDPRVTTTQVGKLIEADPSLTASLLRLVNSPFFGMRRQVASVADAIMVLGMSAVRRMVLSLGVAGAARKAAADSPYAKELWQHTVSCAAIARRLLDDDEVDAEVAFTAGLLHDIGERLLLQEHGNAYAELHASHPEHDVRALEIERFGQAHDALGAELLEAWGLPDPIVRAALNHHAAAPITQLSPVEQAVWVANHLIGSPDDAAKATLHCPDRLAPVKQAMERSRAEIDMLNSLVHA